MKKIPMPTKPAYILLLIELTVILLASLTLLLSYLTDRAADAVLADSYYSGTLEYVAASLMIAVGSAVIVDLSCREKKKN